MQSYLFVLPWGRLSCSNYPQAWPVLCLYQNAFLILRLISVPMRKYHTLTKRNLGEESVYFSLRVADHHWENLGTQVGIEGSCLGNFLTQFRVTCPGSGTAHSGLDLYQLAIPHRIIPHRHPTDQSNKDTELSFFSGVLVCHLES